jgi:DeoR/GlpR family transcriptional regulator of sugar metabolism
MIERHKRILEALAEGGRTPVSFLSEELGVSQVTVRKDLIALEELGLVRRAHGYASLGSVDDVSARLAYHYDVKKRIAQAAAARVSPGETVMIESGSCCALLAEILAEDVRDVTIVTNSAFIAGCLRSAPRPKVVLLGGDYQPRSQVMVGPLTKRCAESFFVDRLFLGTDGFAPEYGFMGGDLMRTETVRAMRSQARRAVILTDSSKFSRRGVVAQMAFSEVSEVFTDGGIPEDARSLLAAQGVEVVIA